VKVSDVGDDTAVGPDDYIHTGRVTEFRHGAQLSDVIRRTTNQRLAHLWNYGSSETWHQLRSRDAVVFTDNHDTQRDAGFNGSRVLTFRESNLYKIANAFQLAWQYGHVRVMSSYYWPKQVVNDKDQVCIFRSCVFSTPKTPR